MRKIIFVILFFVASSLVPVYAKCMRHSDAYHQCRYVDGDSWCSKRNRKRPYAYHDQCLQDLEYSRWKGYHSNGRQPIHIYIPGD